MGLDMYLSAKRYLWSDQDKDLAKQVGEIIGVDGDPEKRFNGASLVVKEISLEAMYWRKANAIHGWFVETVQDGEDNCREYEVDKEQLETLRDLCKDILEHPDAERDEDLDPTEGFFFGSYNKDEWYYKDLKDTVEGLDKVLALPDEYSFTYQASW
ncbi:MAG: hypothetical protein RL373_40 [Pseudomonadota bacterium]|jgi:hypothetical protein